MRGISDREPGAGGTGGSTHPCRMLHPAGHQDPRRHRRARPSDRHGVGMNYEPVDVLVVGAGNAAANAALAAHASGASVAMLETAPPEARAGNSAFTGGAFRFVYDGIETLLKLDP